MGGRRWDLTHNPNIRPLGCNGKYGHSGAAGHRRRGETVCRRCQVSQNHYQRERTRGGLSRPRALEPCGTNAAAERHRANGEDLCLPCKVALAQRVQKYRDSKKAMDVHQS